jgi:hypothetical protein
LQQTSRLLPLPRRLSRPSFAKSLAPRVLPDEYDISDPDR